MHKKFEINRTKIKGSCQSGRKVVPHDSKKDLPLVDTYCYTMYECLPGKNAKGGANSL